MSHLPYNFRKCRKLITSVTNDVQTWCHDNDTKEPLMTPHMADLKSKNWATRITELLTPERSPETVVLEGNAPLIQLEKRWRSSTMIQKRYNTLQPFWRSAAYLKSAGAFPRHIRSAITLWHPFWGSAPYSGSIVSPLSRMRRRSFEIRRKLCSNSWFHQKIPDPTRWFLTGSKHNSRG